MRAKKSVQGYKIFNILLIGNLYPQNNTTLIPCVAHNKRTIRARTDHSRVDRQKFPTHIFNFVI